MSDKTQIDKEEKAKELQNLPSNLMETIREIEQLNPKPFSVEAFKTLKENISIYIMDLIDESIKNSKRGKVDNVSSLHVEKAHSYLISKKRGKGKRIAGTVGGIFLGATLSNVFTFLSSGSSVEMAGFIVTTIFGIIGAFLIAISFTGE